MATTDLRKIKRSIERDFKELERAIKQDFKKLLQQETRNEKRVPIPSKTKKAVFERAKGRCESCGRPLKITDKGANFHHLREPTAKSRPSSIQFLCATCHMNHGHDHKTRTGYDQLGRPIKKVYIVRKKVPKDRKSPYWKKKTKSTRKKTKRKITSKKTKSKTTKTPRRRRKKR